MGGQFRMSFDTYEEKPRPVKRGAEISGPPRGTTSGARLVGVATPGAEVLSLRYAERSASKALAVEGGVGSAERRAA
jgi:hypothetical protein